MLAYTPDVGKLAGRAAVMVPPLSSSRTRSTQAKETRGGSTTSCFIGLGANLGDPRRAVEEAKRRLSLLAETRVVLGSKTYGSLAIGPAQPTYINTALKIETALEPLALLESVKGIERDMGRITGGPRWSPRVIDLDILLYGALELRTDVLLIPHPELTKRRFVLQPLADLAPDLVVPGVGRTIRALLDALDDDPNGVWLDEPLDTGSFGPGS